jgi:hypothetical protein
MPERDAPSTDSSSPPSGAPETPRVSGEQLVRPEASEEAAGPSSSQRPATSPDEPVVSEPGDTLLSAGKPADRLELLLEDRLGIQDDRIAELDHRITELDARLSLLEQKKSTPAPEPRQKPWVWIAFMIALVVVFQLLRRVR